MVLAAAARSSQAVIAPLAKFEAPQGRKVAAEAGHEKRKEAHGSPAGTAGPWTTRTGIVGTGVLIVSGAVVEETLDAAETSPIVNEALRRAEAALVAEPAGRQGAGSRAMDALTAPTFLTDKEMSGVKAGLLCHPLQRFLRLQVSHSGRRPDDGVPGL